MYCQNDPGHLVAIEFDDGVGHLDFAMMEGAFLGNRRFGGDGVIIRGLSMQTGEASRYALSAHPLGRTP